jgi:hypothetical protein
MNKLIREHRVRAQYRMKRQADKDRSERVFDVDTMIYLKLQPYVQSSIFSRANQKLSFKYFGPFHIRVGAVAYHLELPDNSAIHPVAHVSQLKLRGINHVTNKNTLSSLPQAMNKLFFAAFLLFLNSLLLILFSSGDPLPIANSSQMTFRQWKSGTRWRLRRAARLRTASSSHPATTLRTGVLLAA